MAFGYRVVWWQLVKVKQIWAIPQVLWEISLIMLLLLWSLSEAIFITLIVNRIIIIWLRSALTHFHTITLLKAVLLSHGNNINLPFKDPLLTPCVFSVVNQLLTLGYMTELLPKYTGYKCVHAYAHVYLHIYVCVFIMWWFNMSVWYLLGNFNHQ